MPLYLFAGKLQNIEEIEKSTEDDINKDNIEEIAKSTTEDYHYKIPSPVSVVKKTPKPKTIPQGKTWMSAYGSDTEGMFRGGNSTQKGQEPF